MLPTDGSQSFGSSLGEGEVAPYETLDKYQFIVERQCIDAYSGKCLKAHDEWLRLHRMALSVQFGIQRGILEL